MTIALSIVTATHFVVASLTALNSVLEAERNALAARDLAAVALVGAAWPVVGYALLSAQACRKDRA